MIVDVLDVGHGGCVVVRSASRVVVIDVAKWDVLREYCRREGIDTVHAVVLSHLDDDHVRGAVSLLSSSLFNGHVYVNPDLFARERAGTRDEPSAPGTGTSKSRRKRLLKMLVSMVDEVRPLTTGLVVDCQGAVLGSCAWPPHSVFLSFPEEIEHWLDYRLTRNRTSMIVRWTASAGAGAWTFGDSDIVARGALERLPVDSRGCGILVFPHHGSVAGGVNAEYARWLANYTGASTIVFQNGRGRWDLPKEEVVDGVVGIGTVVCTQLNRKCCPGKESDRHCGGDIRFDGMSGRVETSRDDHGGFVDRLVEAGKHPLCRPIEK